MENRNNASDNITTTAGAYRDDAERAAETAANKARELADTAREKARDLTSTAQHKADAGMHTAAERMSGAAETVRGRTDTIAGVTADAGIKIADEMDHTADYLRDSDSQKLIGDIGRYAKAHPVQAIAGGLFGLFLLRRLMH